MRNKNILILTILFLKVLYSNAQTNNCGTPDIDTIAFKALPYYGNENYLTHYYDSLVNVYNNPTQNLRSTENDVEKGIWFRIPVHFWIYRESATVNGGNDRLPNDRDIKRIMDDLNGALQRGNIPVRFYVRCVDFVNDGGPIEMSGFDEQFTIANQYRESKTMNVHIVDRFTGGWGGINNPLYDAVFIRRNVTFDTTRATVFTHEVGHYLGLFHTFQFFNFPCLRETVRRDWSVHVCPPFYSRRCALTGDGLCDTPADPNMSENGVFNRNNCTWSWDRTDYYGDAYQPSTRNYMAYGNEWTPCLPMQFTADQKKVMLWTITNLKPLQSAFWTPTSANAFDIYEPDNSDISASDILLNEAQRHSFHSSGCTPDTEDWVRFLYPTTGSLGAYFIEIKDVAGFTNPVTQVELWSVRTDANGNFARDVQFVLSSPVIGAGTRTIQIPCNSLVKGNRYLVRVRGSGVGQYELKVKDPLLEQA